ncbi:g13521 [Coccomyxa viridis]|uniref:G13521 protein n=1 Tax=Coccomyxa viridis TaxID=1274662 RepID=A0ABP1GD93_9CHLO
MRGLLAALPGLARLRININLDKVLLSSRSRSSTGSSDDLNTALVESALNDALDFCSYIDQSADQAYLEAEPATRTTKDEYVMRYQHFAKSGLEQALKKYTALHDNIGDSEMKALKRQDVNFALVVADSLLARDKLDRALKSGQERLREKQASGLKREDLIFCDD